MSNTLSELDEKGKKTLDSFVLFSGERPDGIERLAQAGSDRSYYRFRYGNKSMIGVFSNNVEENNTFIYFTQLFKSLDIKVPELFYVTEDKTVYFLEDLGDMSLFDMVQKDIKNGELTDTTKTLYKKTITELAKMQITSAVYIDFDKCYQISEFNEESILFDLNYFKFYFLKVSGIKFDERKLQNDFNNIALNLAKSGDKFFMFRDFQARNIMIKDGEPYFIDYQGGRKGAIQYDLASLLFQAKARLSEDVKEELLEHYIEQVQSYIPVEKDEFVNQFYFYSLIRILQTLGAYGFRGLIEKKSHFIESIPFAIKNVSTILEKNELFINYQELHEVLSQLATTDRFNPVVFPEFTITVTSFSYKKSYPEDKTGNGGGFVFDCRGIENPGRYSQYKSITGKDKAVIEFFKQHSDIDKYMLNVIKTVKPTIDNYIERDFNSLSISFGCTGGQHRSVYCAEQMIVFLQNNYNVKVRLIHRELRIETQTSNSHSE
ncbi:MAG: RNase adapter RapZ [Bacteroidales bacterium]|nr:RNase adapter RapZ [Bacteroidales bacterium]